MHMHGTTHRLLLRVLLACVPLGIAEAQNARPPVVTVPVGRSILIDGRAEPEEWADARTIVAAPDVELHLKRDARFLYVAVVRARPVVFGVNLYLGAPGATEYLDLHASAKLGERRGRMGGWPEWSWWNNADWAANVTRGESFEQRRFLPDSAKEFQIRLSRLPGQEIVLSLDVETAQGTTPLLQQGAERDGLRWITLRL
jgi:hypothetical protein